MRLKDLWPSADTSNPGPIRRELLARAKNERERSVGNCLQMYNYENLLDICILRTCEVCQIWHIEIAGRNTYLRQVTNAQDIGIMILAS